MREQNWFEMKDLRRRTIESAVWIPLRANRKRKIGSFGFEGFEEEYSGAGTLCIPVAAKELAEDLEWANIGLSHTHAPNPYKGAYDPCDVFPLSEEFEGIPLVLDQHFNNADANEWHLHQDFVIALGLKREGDTWLSCNEGYIEVARLHRSNMGHPILLECRAEHLKDYLCARSMELRIAAFHSRYEITASTEHILWTENPFSEEGEHDQWEGSIQEIHEGGNPFGQGISILQIGRTDVDHEVDVPEFDFPVEGATKSDTKYVKYEGKKLFLIRGELWRIQQLGPASKSPRVLGNDLPPSVSFITKSDGTREDKITLVHGSRWLWFRPTVIPALLQFRGSRLSWHTRDTGRVRCSPDYGVDFGMNTASLINVYAKDIGELPDWQQQVWAGHNISPDGRVSEELLSAQMKCEPAATLAPEDYLSRAISNLNEVSKHKYSESLIREHADIADIIRRCHRFRALDRVGLFTLAKDLARITADAFNVAALRKIAAQGDSKLGSLKLMERAVALKTSEQVAHEMLGPLFGIYDLRLADAHLASGETDASLVLVGIDSAVPFVLQGLQMIHACVATLYRIAEVMAE